MYCSICRASKQQAPQQQPLSSSPGSSSGYPSDLPPRKDSPFPQAIAAEKYQREHQQYRRTHHHHSAGKQNSTQQTAWLVQQHRLYNQVRRSGFVCYTGLILSTE